MFNTIQTNVGFVCVVKTMIYLMGGSATRLSINERAVHCPIYNVPTIRTSIYYLSVSMKSKEEVIMKQPTNKIFSALQKSMWVSRFIFGLAIVTIIASAVIFQISMRKVKSEAVSDQISLMESVQASVGVVNDLRGREYDLMSQRTDIVSNQNTIEQNINLAYTLICKRSETTSDDAMVRIIEQHIVDVRETMTASELMQAISILKENFPNESFADLDAIEEINSRLMDQLTKQKEKYNAGVEEYNKLYEDHTEELNGIGFSPMNFSTYQLGD